MARTLVPLLLIVALVGAYFVFFHEAPPASDGTSELAGDPGEAPTPKKDLSSGKDGTGLEIRAPVAPTAKPERAQLKIAANVVMVAKLPGPWAALMEIIFGSMEDLGYRTWYLEQPGVEGGRAGAGRGLAELTAQPTGDYLIEHDVRGLVLDGVDPNAFPQDFWNVVSERVRTGSMGVWFQPGVPFTGNRTNTQHAALTHPVLGDLLPVGRVALFQGDPIPGVYAEPQRLEVSEAGAAHLATRLVANPEASVRVWRAASEKPGCFATKFCYPVLQLKPGAQALLNVDAATRVPALIVSAPSVGRVLWMGQIDYGDKTYFNAESNALQQLVVTHQLLWLVGQAEGE